jgi:hypothetical protein
MTREVGVAGRRETVQEGKAFQLRFNITLKFFSGERDERAHHVLTVSCLFLLCIGHVQKIQIRSCRSPVPVPPPHPPPSSPHMSRVRPAQLHVPPALPHARVHHRMPMSRNVAYRPRRSPSLPRPPRPHRPPVSLSYTPPPAPSRCFVLLFTCNDACPNIRTWAVSHTRLMVCYLHLVHLNMCISAYTS